jgi:hypothetical protein
MNKIYVVTAFGGSYDDAWQENICACLTQEDAELKILEFRERDARLEKISPNIIEEYGNAFRSTIEGLMFEEIPPFPNKGKFKNDKLYDDALTKWQHSMVLQMLHNEHARKRIEWEAAKVARKLAIELGCSDEDLSYLGFQDDGTFSGSWGHHFDDCDYSIEELEIK